MVAQNRGEEILLVTNSSEELSDIKYLLEMDFPHLTAVLGEEQGVEKFSEIQPAALILAFRQIEQAEEFYLLLHRKYPQAGEQLYQTLLLCTSREAKKAYQLCTTGVFDDYLVDRPLHDPEKIRLAIEQILVRRKIERELSALHRQNREVSRGASSFDHEHRQRLAASVQQHTQLQESFGEMEEMLQQHLQEYPDVALEQLLQQTHDVLGSVTAEFGEIERTFSEKLESLQHQPQQTSILLVDDDDFYREEIASMLERSGYNILEADSGAAALNQLKTVQPKLILLDYMMPGMNGLDTLKQIHQNPRLAELPVIMLTGYSDKTIVRELLKVGISGYIIKPGTRDQLLNAISQVLAKTEE